MTKYELEKLVDILNTNLYNDYTELLKSNEFYISRTESDGAFEYEDFLTGDEHHCITHVMKFNRKDDIINSYWEVSY